jgi:phage terminase large subunit
MGRRAPLREDVHDIDGLAAPCSRKPNGRYAYIAPLYNQAKTVAWDVIKQFTRPVLRGAPNEAELRVDLIGGSRISLYGGDNPDRLRGLGLDGVVLDDSMPYMSPSLFPSVVSGPMNGG